MEKRVRRRRQMVVVEDIPHSVLTPEEVEALTNAAAEKVFNVAYERLGKNVFRWLVFALGVGALYIGHAIVKSGWNPFK